MRDSTQTPPIPPIRWQARARPQATTTLCAGMLMFACAHEQNQPAPSPSGTSSTEAANETDLSAPEPHDGAQACATPEKPAAAEPEIASGEARVFDRVLVRAAKELQLDERSLRESIQAITSERVERIGGGPLTWRVVVFAPRDPPRDAAAQKALVEALRQIPELEKVEPDRIMFAK